MTRIPRVYPADTGKMDYKEPQVKRAKKRDKAKEKHERNGHFSAKHVRLAEDIQAKGVAKEKAKPKYGGK